MLFRSRPPFRADRSEPRSTGGDPASAAMDRYAAGDDAAFAELYDLLSPRLYAFLLRATRQVELAQDLLQQTLLQVHRARGSFIAGAEVMPWVIAIARRLVIDHARSPSRRDVLVDDAEDAPTADAEEAVAEELVHARDLASKMEIVAARLPESQRIAFELSRRQGLSLAEIARTLNITVGAVKVRLHRAHQALRAAFDRLEEQS